MKTLSSNTEKIPYETPQMEILLFRKKDVVCASGDNGQGDIFDDEW